MNSSRAATNPDTLQLLMARQEQDREDLLAEATALVERVELLLTDGATVFVGFRRDGGPSVYCGADPVYQFNTGGALRRAYVAGQLYKAEQGRLVRLTRVREATQVLLVRHELDDAETSTLLADATTRLKSLGEAIALHEARVVGQVPPDGDVLSKVRRWLDQQKLPPEIASTPRANG